MGKKTHDVGLGDLKRAALKIIFWKVRGQNLMWIDMYLRRGRIEVLDVGGRAPRPTECSPECGWQSISSLRLILPLGSPREMSCSKNLFVIVTRALYESHADQIPTGSQIIRDIREDFLRHGFIAWMFGTPSIGSVASLHSNIPDDGTAKSLLYQRNLGTWRPWGYYTSTSIDDRFGQISSRPPLSLSISDRMASALGRRSFYLPSTPASFPSCSCLPSAAT